MKQNIINARVTFRKSPIHVLEKFAFKDMPNACLTFKKNSGVSECVIIQTCNRIELFATSDNHNVDEIKNTWASLTGLENNAFRDTLEVCENRDAYEHLLKLTSGLESLVVGEEQILGQIKYHGSRFIFHGILHFFKCDQEIWRCGCNKYDFIIAES